MPKAGNYEYPTRDLDDCINYLAKAHKISQTFAMKRDSFARAIALSPKGGGYGLILGSMGMYKLIDNAEGDIRYTDLAQKILFGQPKERDELKNSAVRNVRIFADIYDRFGENPTDEQLRHFLREKANVVISKEGQLATDIGNLFKRVVQYLKPIEGGGERMQFDELTPAGTAPALATLSTPNITIKITDELSLKTAEGLLQAFGEKIRTQEKSQKSKKDDLVNNSNSAEGREKA